MIQYANYVWEASHLFLAVAGGRGAVKSIQLREIINDMSLFARVFAMLKPERRKEGRKEGRKCRASIKGNRTTLPIIPSKSHSSLWFSRVFTFLFPPHANTKQQQRSGSKTTSTCHDLQTYWWNCWSVKVSGFTWGIKMRTFFFLQVFLVLSEQTSLPAG